jgi:hypothetical protein
LINVGFAELKGKQLNTLFLLAYFDRTVLTDIHIKHNRPDIIILNKPQKLAYLLDIAVPNSHNITQTYNTKINKYLELSVAMRNLWCLEKISILPLVISTTAIVPQSLFKNLKILDLGNTLVVEIQKGILLYSGHIVRKLSTLKPRIRVSSINDSIKHEQLLDYVVNQNKSLFGKNYTCKLIKFCKLRNNASRFQACTSIYYYQ